ncbi:restriction endonuclease subunit S [Chrysosporum bergii ANA360D]|uniref:Restriction endonuclease subunit S n=1 Tax=Chrysosporum bergii ANA360D TaxID=617107 RepID=A0AA43GQW0_9CYAN|nr:restriction endonuclease subunit S [Chrysosporum bergii]MDH6060009.1 restriction endonuclease subunit S [Chrysosporum bergii ANA360D]
MKRYPKYKNSGVQWLGDIPEHWEVKKLAFFGKFLKGSTISKSDLVDNGLPVILYGDIYTKYTIKVNNIINFISQELANTSKPIYKDDILFTGSGETREDIGKCIVYLGDSKAYTGGDILIFRQNINDSLFISYFLNSNYAIFQKATNSRGDVIVHIYSSSLRNISVTIPPLEEQKQIASFLDEKIEKINQYISNKQRLIELLKEQKTAIINHVVTKGLNPDAPMKPSGIEWLGDIPEGWEVKRAKYYFYEVDERSESGTEELLSVSHINVSSTELKNGRR